MIQGWAETETLSYKAKVMRQCKAEAIDYSAEVLIQSWAETIDQGAEAVLQCWAEAELFFGAVEDLFGEGNERFENQWTRTMLKVRMNTMTSLTKDQSGHALWHDQSVVTG